MKRYRMEVRRALYRIGVRDARLGKKPTNKFSAYLRGFGDQYAKEQIQSSQPQF